MDAFGVSTDYEYSATHKRQRIQVWAGAFYGEWVADGLSLPSGGFMLATGNDGEKIRVQCPSPRTLENYAEVDKAVSEAMTRLTPLKKGAKK